MMSLNGLSMLFGCVRKSAMDGGVLDSSPRPPPPLFFFFFLLLFGSLSNVGCLSFVLNLYPTGSSVGYYGVNMKSIGDERPDLLAYELKEILKMFEEVRTVQLNYNADTMR